jgi:hypothetical protein
LGEMEKGLMRCVRFGCAMRDKIARNTKPARLIYGGGGMVIKFRWKQMSYTSHREYNRACVGKAILLIWGKPNNAVTSRKVEAV